MLSPLYLLLLLGLIAPVVSNEFNYSDFLNYAVLVDSLLSGKVIVDVKQADLGSLFFVAELSLVACTVEKSFLNMPIVLSFVYYYRDLLIFPSSRDLNAKFRVPGGIGIELVLTLHGND